MPRIIDTEELMRNAPFELSHADKEVLATTKENFIPHTWEDFQKNIACGDTSQLKRTPTYLRNHIFWTREIQATFGSVMNFLMRKRLHWEEAANKDQIRFPLSPFSSLL